MAGVSTYFICQGFSPCFTESIKAGHNLYNYIINVHISACTLLLFYGICHMYYMLVVHNCLRGL